jgi:ABC-type sugar transport system substrate-binding protein
VAQCSIACREWPLEWPSYSYWQVVATTATPTAAPTAAPTPPPYRRPTATPGRLGGAAAFTGSVVMIPKQINNPYFDVAFKGAQNAATLSAAR